MARGFWRKAGSRESEKGRTESGGRLSLLPGKEARRAPHASQRSISIYTILHSTKHRSSAAGPAGVRRGTVYSIFRLLALFHQYPTPETDSGHTPPLSDPPWTCMHGRGKEERERGRGNTPARTHPPIVVVYWCIRGHRTRALPVRALSHRTARQLLWGCQQRALSVAIRYCPHSPVNNPNTLLISGHSPLPSLFPCANRPPAPGRGNPPAFFLLLSPFFEKTD